MFNHRGHKSGFNLAVIVFLGMLCLAGCFFGQPEQAADTTTSRPTETSGPTLTPTATFTPSPTPTPMPVIVSAEEMVEVLAALEVPGQDPYEFYLRTQSDSAIVPRANTEPKTYEIGDIRLFDTYYGAYSTSLVYQNDLVSMWVQKEQNLDPSMIAYSADYFADQIYEANREVFGEEWSPGIDADYRIHIVNIEVSDDVGGFFEPLDEYPEEVLESASNEGEIFYMNISLSRPGSPEYLSTLAHEFQHMIQWNIDQNEQRWLDEGLAQLSEFLLGLSKDNYNASNYLTNTLSRLDDWPSVEMDDETYRHYGAAYLYLLYIYENYGVEAISAISHSPENGLDAVDSVLKEYGTSANEVFSDWMVANFIDNTDIYDGQYGYESHSLRTACPQQQLVSLPVSTEYSIPQYAPNYHVFSQPGAYHIQFEGEPNASLFTGVVLQQSFMWSYAGDNIDSTLTRSFDLSGASKATLNVKMSLKAEEMADYAYVEVSKDGGESWIIVETIDDRTASWQELTISLTPYTNTDGEVLVRFEYITDGTINHYGLVIDEIEIPELGYYEDFETGDGGWLANGFVRTSNAVTQEWTLALIKSGETVEVLPVDVDGSGLASIDFDLAEGGQAVFVVAGISPGTLNEADYRLNIDGDAEIVASTQELGEGVLFADDFSFPCSGWNYSTTLHHAGGYDNDRFFLKTMGQYEMAEAFTQDIYEEAVVDVEMRWDYTPSLHYAGLACAAAEYGNYYSFTIDNNGYYLVDRLVDGNWVTLIDWTFSPFINQGQGSMNRLKLQCDEERAAFAVNGVTLASFSDYDHQPGKIGLIAGTYDDPYMQVSFDNLTIREPSEETQVAGGSGGGVQAAESGDVLFRDDFSVVTNWWPLASDADYSYSIENGQLIGSFYSPNLAAWINPRKEFGDVIVDVDVAWGGQEVAQSAGITCFDQWEGSFYTFTIGSYGDYTIDQLSGGSWVPIVDWAQSGVINRGAFATNHLTATCTADRLAFAVNGATVADVGGLDLNASGYMGLIAGSYDTPGVTVTFDNLVVTKP
ncbi:MAG: immune inhibitor A [Anaerolineae bacterium]|nr:immune inhibitor A [Anaerolineae bacterium]